MNQLLSITQNIYNSCHNGLEIRRVFLDISKTIDKVWLERLLYKLGQYGMSGDVLKVMTDFLYGIKNKLLP